MRCNSYSIRNPPKVVHCNCVALIASLRGERFEKRDSEVQKWISLPITVEIHAQPRGSASWCVPGREQEGAEELAIKFIIHIAMGNRNIKCFVGRKSRIGKVGEAKHREILDGIWGLDLDTNVSCPAAYIEHYRQTQLVVRSSPLRSIGTNKTIDLVKLVKEHHGQSIATIKNELRSSQTKWAIHDVDDAAASRAVETITMLWLMATPSKMPSELGDKLFLRDIVAQGFENSNPSVPAAARSIKELSPDFSSLNLSRKAGIKILYTSCLTEHLLMSGKRQLRVFHHASMLRKYRELNSVEKYVYFFRSSCCFGPDPS